MSQFWNTKEMPRTELIRDALCLVFLKIHVTVSMYFLKINIFSSMKQCSSDCFCWLILPVWAVFLVNQREALSVLLLEGAEAKDISCLFEKKTCFVLQQQQDKPRSWSLPSWAWTQDSFYRSADSSFTHSEPTHHSAFTLSLSLLSWYLLLVFPLRHDSVIV